MPKRRDILGAGITALGASVVFTTCKESKAQSNPSEDMLKYLCVPDGIPDPLEVAPSPNAERFKAKLFVPPIKVPMSEPLNPPANPEAHQLYSEFEPRKFYEILETEIKWVYHPDPPYDQGSYSWGFDNITPGPTYHAYYGEPVLVRRINSLPPIGVSKVVWALPSTTAHLHNGHTASESDGNPQDWIDPGEFWDHHYGNFPSGGASLPRRNLTEKLTEEEEEVNREKLTTLWYHDHRLDFTAANVYAGLAGFYLLFDEEDSNNENDPNPKAWRLPSGKYDVPLLFHDVQFDSNAGIVFNSFFTDGWLGDQVTVNRKIRPFHEVERRKYRFRILNGGPSRFYQFFLRKKGGDYIPFVVITGDGNILPQPVRAESIYLSVAQRYDIIIDFSEFEDGDEIILENHLEQTNGKGPTGRMLQVPDGVLSFKVKGPVVEDPSRVPERFRPLPKIDLSEVVRERLWVFDYVGGLWTINGKIMDPNRIDAGIDHNSAEIWTFRNGGNNWSHPVHCHFTEFLILEVNGKPYNPSYINSLDGIQHKFIKALGTDDDPVVPVFMGGPRRDVATLLPNDEIKVFIRFKDFFGKHVMHCHNVVHEDHAMMIRWDMVEPGLGFDGPVDAFDFYNEKRPPSHIEPRPGQATYQSSDEQTNFENESGQFENGTKLK